jgi:hypothetical protein
MTSTAYWADSKAPRYSLLFALPLVVIYEALGIMLASPGGGGIRNAADVLLKRLFATFAGTYGDIVFWTCLIGVGLWLVARDIRRSGGALKPAVFLVMLAEAAFLALLVGAVVGTLTSTIVRPPVPALMLMQGGPRELDLPTRIMVSIGAGLYEELLFRVLLVSFLAYTARHLLGLPTGAAMVWAAVGGALVFSAFHYLGPLGDRVELYSFTFRFLAGLFFSALFLLRGFGITAWTHALYDVFLLVV